MKDLEKIIRYLDGEMLGDEKFLFEQELVGDKSLNQSKLLMDEIDRAIDDDQVFAFKAKLAETQALCNAINDADYVVGEETGVVLEQSSKYRRISWKYVASAVITLLVVASVLFYNFSKTSNDKIFASYYHRYEADYEAAGVNSRSDAAKVSKLINAVQLYDLGNTNSAIIQFEEIIKADPENTAAHFFAGLALIENQDYDKAISNLLFVISKNDLPYIEQSEWYLALCYLKKDQRSQAKALLNKIANSESYYKIKALDLLKKLQ
jgi:hypothetical protein